MLHVIINEELYDQEFVENWTVGFAELRTYVQDFTPEKGGPDNPGLRPKQSKPWPGRLPPRPELLYIPIPAWSIPIAGSRTSGPCIFFGP
ncbi:MAG: hypothetical protein RQM92_00635 [Candidatus Syntrophopropionicum ammoniitolerans]